MARDDAARDSETERSPLDRRSSRALARATGAAVATDGIPADERRTSTDDGRIDAEGRAGWAAGDRFDSATAPEGHDGTQ